MLKLGLKKARFKCKKMSYILVIDRKIFTVQRFVVISVFVFFLKEI